MIHQLIYIHATMYEPAAKCRALFYLFKYLTCISSFYSFPFPLVFLYDLVISGQAQTAGYFILFLCSKFYQSYLLCIRMDFASRFLVLTGNICERLTNDVCIRKGRKQGRKGSLLSLCDRHYTTKLQDLMEGRSELLQDTRQPDRHISWVFSCNGAF